MKSISSFLFFALLLINIGCDPDPVENNADFLQISSVKLGQTALSSSETKTVENSDAIFISLSKSVDLSTVSNILLINEQTNTEVETEISTLDTDKIIQIKISTPLIEGDNYNIDIPNSLAAADGGSFSGLSYKFIIEKGDLVLTKATADDSDISSTVNNQNISLNPLIQLTFNQDFDTEVLLNNISIVSGENFTFQVEKLSPGEFQITLDQALPEFSRATMLLSSAIGADIGRSFTTAVFRLYTELDGIPDFPLISDEDLLSLVQSQTFKYFYDFAHPNSGLARERNTSGNTVTTGGSGFGLMTLIVGVERGFITRDEAITRWEKVFDFLESADRFHGAWSHWVDGDSGKVRPFSQLDDGGDIVETAFLVQGMLTVRQYLNSNDATENALINQITKMWEEVEWDWYTRGDQKKITWHWSPNFEFQINLNVSGHNETQIVYILAAASPTHPIDKETYSNGYARNGNMQNGNTFYEKQLPLGSNRGGPLFFTHYSYLGLDPRNLEDQYANYWEQNIAHTLINRSYCIDNPENHIGYSEACWGLTASDGNEGYSAHSPNNDRGVITPTAAISSLPFTPDESMQTIRHFYYDLGHKLWGEYGFYDAFNPTAGWVASSYLAIDQGPIVCMIENHRTALLWDLFMSDSDVLSGLDKLEFNY